MKKFLAIFLTIFCFFIFSKAQLSAAQASPIISGISTNEINIDTKFRGAKILLFGAKGDAGDIVIVVRGPKKNFLVTKKQKFLGIWYNGERVKFKDSYSFYSLFSTFNDQEKPSDQILAELELGKDNLQFRTTSDVKEKKKDEFKAQLIERLEDHRLYSDGANKIDFLDETLFKVMLDFPKNISRGAYTAEIYLINEGSLLSFQSIPIYVNQVGLSASILDFAYQEPFLYGLLAVAIALVIGWLASHIFIRFVGK
jgi:uncharacterized protein (TIGR02186 family)